MRSDEFPQKKHDLGPRHQNRPRPVQTVPHKDSTKERIGQFLRDVVKSVQFDINSIVFALFLFALIFPFIFNSLIIFWLSTYVPLFLTEVYASLKTHDNHNLYEIHFRLLFW